MNGFPFIPTERERYFFSDAENCARLLSAVARVKGTPFRRQECFPGVGGGCDCVGLCEFLLHESGATPKFHFPRRRRDYSQHVINDKILRYFRGLVAEDSQSAMLHARFVEFPADLKEFMVGDVVAMKTGVSLFHLPIVIDPPRCLQCASPDGVSECDATDPQYAKHIEAVFRARAL